MTKSEFGTLLFLQSILDIEGYIYTYMHIYSDFTSDVKQVAAYIIICIQCIWDVFRLPRGARVEFKAEGARESRRLTHPQYQHHPEKR